MLPCVLQIVAVCYRSQVVSLHYQSVFHDIKCISILACQHVISISKCSIQRQAMKTSLACLLVIALSIIDVVWSFAAKAA